MLALLMQPAAAGNSPHHDGLTASDIIERMQTTYATSRSYRDTGTVKELYIDANGERVIEKPFTTAFVRPGRFRYEFREKPPYEAERRFVIHQWGEHLRTHWDLEHDLELNTLDQAIAAATGVSGESAITVPGMLLPKQITWRRAIRFRIPTRIDDEKLGDTDCYRIVDRVSRGLITLWIGKQDGLLRKTYLERSFDDFRVQRTTTYKPEINAAIDATLLEFNPPANAPWWRI
jgi:outer membrane lipoprotein-sorting protein